MNDEHAGRLIVVRHGQSWVVVDKPSGLLSVPGKGPNKQDCAAARVQAMRPEATGPMVVHRLDMDTSGLMVIALDACAQRALSMQFEKRTVEKRYEAIVEGAPAGEAGEVRLRQRLDVDHRPFQIVDEAQGKLAATRWRRLEIGAVDLEAGRVRTRIDFAPITGRSHQLRLASAAPVPTGLGCPIVGDVLYGNANPDEGRLLLAATHLAFDDPVTGKRVEVTLPAPF